MPPACLPGHFSEGSTLTWQGLLLDKEGGATDGAGEVVRAALLQPVPQAAQMVHVPAWQHLGRLQAMLST